MIFPLLWQFGASFKTNQEIFTSLSILPKDPVTGAYQQGWKGSGQYGFSRFFGNTFILVLPTVLFTLISSTLTAYGFARFDFFGRKFLFMIMLSTLMLPQAVLLVPRYILFREFGWLNSYLPFYTPALLAQFPFFIFMMVQFLRGIPKEFDESAFLDGCTSFSILTHIILPLSKPAIFSLCIFQFIWTWNDFFNVLIYINSVSKYTVALGLRMALDIDAMVNWNEIMAMSVLSMLPPIIIFFLAQRYFVEGISASGLKG
jgi:oligogalacturonide transport system permease protein